MLARKYVDKSAIGYERLTLPTRCLADLVPRVNPTPATPSHDLHVRVGYLHVGNLSQLLYCCVSASDCIVTCCVVIG